MTVKVLGNPAHPFEDGIMVIVAIIVELETLVAVKDGISPAPPAPSPIAVLLFVQVKVVPGNGPLKAVAEAGTPLQ